MSNNDLGADAVILPYIIGSIPLTDFDLYMALRPEGEKCIYPSYLLALKNPKRLPNPDKTKLLYHVKRLTNVYYLYIPLSVIPDILKIAYVEGYLGFFRCYEIFSLPLLVHMRPYKALLLLHLPLPSVSGLPNQTTSSLRVTSTNKVISHPFFYTNPRLCAHVSSVKEEL